MESLAGQMRLTQREDGRTVEQTFSKDDLKRIHQRLDENDPASRGGTESKTSTSGPIAGCNNAPSDGTRAQARIFAREARKSVGGQVSSSDDSEDDMHDTGQGPDRRPSGKDSSQRIVDQLSLSTHPSAALPDGPSFQQSIEGRQRAFRSEKVCGRCLCCKEFEVQMQRLADEIKRYPMWALIQELERLQLVELEYFEGHAQNFEQAKTDIAEQKQRNEKVRQADLKRIAALEAQCSADKDALLRMHEADGAMIHQLQDELKKLALERDRECSELKAMLKTKQEHLKQTLQPSLGSLPEMAQLDAIPKLDFKMFKMPSMPWGVEGWGGGMFTLLSGHDEGQGESDVEFEGKVACLQEELSQLREAIAAAAGAKDALENAEAAAARAAHGGRGAAMRAMESEVSQAKKALLEAEKECNAHALASEKLSDRVVELEQLLKKSEKTAQIQSNSQRKQLSAMVSAEKARRIALAQRIVRRILHNQLAMCWGSFCTRVTETKRKRETCQRVVLRIRHLALTKSFDRFRSSVTQLKADRVKVQRTLARLRSALLATFYDEWHRHVDCEKESRRRASQQAAMADLKRTLTLEQKNNKSLMQNIADRGERVVTQERVVEIPVEVIVYKDRLVEVPVKSIQTVEVIKHIHVDNKAAVESQLEVVKADLAASEAVNEELRAAMEEMRAAVEQCVAEMEHRLQLELEEMLLLNNQDNNLSQDLLERLLAEREHKKETRDSQMQTAWRLGGGEKPPTKDVEVQTFAGMQGLASKMVDGAQNDPEDRERAAFRTEDVLANIPAELDSARSAVSAPPPTPGRTVHYANAVTPNGPVAARTLGNVDASLGQITGDVSSQMSMEAQVRNLNPLANFKAPGMEIPLLSHFPAMSVPVLPGFGFFSGNAMSGSKAEPDGDECQNLHTSPKDEVKGPLMSSAEEDRDPLNEEGFSARLERARKEVAGVPGLRLEAWQPLSFSSLQFASNGPGDV